MLTAYQVLQLMVDTGLLVATLMGVTVAMIAAVIAASKKK